MLKLPTILRIILIKLTLLLCPLVIAIYGNMNFPKNILMNTILYEVVLCICSIAIIRSLKCRIYLQILLNLLMFIILFLLYNYISYYFGVRIFEPEFAKDNPVIVETAAVSTVIGFGISTVIFMVYYLSLNMYNNHKKHGSNTN